LVGRALAEQIASSWLNTRISEHDMPLAELVRHHDDHRPIGLVTCPNCRVDMPRIGLKETESDQNLCEATYRCPQCETETRRWIAL
jgi:hypothetical protein